MFALLIIVGIPKIKPTIAPAIKKANAHSSEGPRKINFAFEPRTRGIMETSSPTINQNGIKKYFGFSGRKCLSGFGIKLCLKGLVC